MSTDNEGKKMKIFGFVGSPRKEGNTAWTVNEILEGAKAQGAETQVLYSGDLDIKPCKGCLGCTKSGVCVINDDMQKIYSALEQADAIVFGSPIYMGQMSGQAKMFADRLFAWITPRFSPRFKEEHAGKKLVLVFTQGNPDPEMFRAYYDYTKKMFQLLEFDVQKVQIVSGTRSGLACEIKGLRDDLRAIGSSLASAYFSGAER